MVSKFQIENSDFIILRAETSCHIGTGEEVMVSVHQEIGSEADGNLEVLTCRKMQSYKSV